MCSFIKKEFKQYYWILLILVLLISFSQSLFAQTNTELDAPYARPVTFNEEDYSALTNTIKARLAQEHGDTSQFYVAQSIVEFCGDDYDCLMNLHHRLRDTMFENRYYLISLALGRTSVKLALQNDDPFNVGLAYIDLSIYYSDLGRSDSVVANLEKSLGYFEEIGACFRIFKVRQELLERKYGGQPTVIVPLMEKNLEDARNMGCDIPSIQHTLKRLTTFTEDGGMWGKFEKYLTELEHTLVPDPTTFEERHAAIYTNSGRAKLYLRENPKQIEKANESLLKALQISKDIPYPLFGVYLLIELAKLEWERQNTDKAFAYLNEAIALGKENEIYFYLSKAYETTAQFREEQGRYKEALEAVRNQHKYSLEHKEKMAGLDLRNYYMEVEKSQMASERKNKELLLQLKDSQLNNLIYVIVFVVLLSLGLLYGFYNQRQSKKQLTNQNVLIHQQAEQLKALDAAKSRFFANVSHELRTPLTLIFAPIKTVLESGTLDNRNFTLLKKVQQSSEDLLKLVASILDLSKLEHGKLALRESPEPIFPLVQRIVSTFESFAGRSGIDLTYIYKAQKNLRLEIDREKVETILNNLLSNAIKFTPKGGKVSVTVEDKGNALLLVVQDTGRGISQNDLPKIFNRFYQSEEKNAPAEGGTGIGLALCQELVHLMKGSIKAESTLGDGSTFFVEFPRKEVMGMSTVEVPTGLEVSKDLAIDKTVNAPVVMETDKNADAIGHRSTILVVEDNHSLRDYLSTILGAHYLVLTAENGKEALELLQGHIDPASSDNDVPPPSLIISDLMMPIMDGFQLLDKLKSDSRFSHLPVVMLTARADIKDKLKALRIGVDDYILKPFDEEEIQVRVGNLLKNYAKRDTAQAVEEESQNTDPITEEDRQWLEAFEAHVQQHLSDETLNVPILAHEFAMSESTILRQLKRLTGLTPAKYLQEIRLDHARQILENRSSNSINKVAIEVGYSDVRSFSRSFKKRFGKSPTELLDV